MREQLIENNNGNLRKGRSQVDELDIKIVNLMAIGASNAEISKRLSVPRPTIQRRTRLLQAKGYVKMRGEINYRKLGYRRGVFHVYLKGNSAKEIAEKIADISGVHDVALFIGNADIVAVFIFKHVDDVLDLKTRVLAIRGVERIMWTEEVYALPEKKMLLMS